jgi:hypothetical protein
MRRANVARVVKGNIATELYFLSTMAVFELGDENRAGKRWMIIILLYGLVQDFEP